MIKFLLFNSFTRAVLRFDFDEAESKMPVRLKVAIAEAFYIFSIFLPYILITKLTIEAIHQFLPGQPTDIEHRIVDMLMLIPTYGLWMAAFNKDLCNGQSVVNRLYGYKVVDNKTGNSPGPLRCMLRNLTAPVFLLELPFILINPERRLGDIIADTKLIKVEKSDPEAIVKEIELLSLTRESRQALVISTALFMIWTIFSRM